MQSRQCATSGLFAANVDHNVWGSNPTLGQGILLTDLNAKQSIFLMTRRRATSKQSNDSSALEHEQTEHMSNARLIPPCTSVYRTCAFHYAGCCARYHSQSPNSQWPLPFRRDPVVRETNWTITGHSKTYFGGWDTKQSINGGPWRTWYLWKAHRRGFFWSWSQKLIYVSLGHLAPVMG